MVPKISLSLLSRLPNSRLGHAREHTRIDGLDHVSMNFLGQPKCAGMGVEAVHCDPVWRLCELVVYLRCLSKMQEVGLLQIPPPRRVGARGLKAHHPLPLLCRNSQIDDQVFGGKTVDAIFKLP